MHTNYLQSTSKANSNPISSYPHFSHPRSKLKHPTSSAIAQQARKTKPARARSAFPRPAARSQSRKHPRPRRPRLFGSGPRGIAVHARVAACNPAGFMAGGASSFFRAESRRLPLIKIPPAGAYLRALGSRKLAGGGR